MTLERLNHGTAVVLLHAMCFDETEWNEVAPRLQIFAPVLIPSLRDFAAAPIATLASDVVEFLDRNDVRKAVLVGHSNGAYVGLELLRTTPKRVAGVILVGAGLAADDEATCQARMDLADWIESQDRLVATDELMGIVFSARSLTERRSIVDHWRPLVERSSPKLVAAALRSIARRFDARKLVQQSSIPVGGINGVEDTILDPAILKNELGEERVRIVAGGGHMLPVEAPDGAAAAIESLLVAMLLVD